MTKRWGAVSFCVLTLGLVARPAAGQQPSNILFSYFNATNSSTVTSGATINMGSVAVASTGSTTLDISNRDTVAWTVSAVTATGQGFQVTTTGSTTIAPSTVLPLTILFSPTVRGTANGALSVSMVSAGTQPQTLVANFALSGTGLEASLVPSYTLVGFGSQVPLADTDAINFPNTSVGQSSSAVVTISNVGNAPGAVSGVALAPGAFRITGLPALPVQLGVGAQLSFTVQFVPTSQQSATALMQLILFDRTVKVTLNGQGVGPTFVYQATIGTTVSSVVNFGTLTLPGTNVSSTSSATFVIQNTGSGAGQISSISISGSGFQLANLPSLPTTIQPGQGVTFTLIFAPTQSGTIQARLLIDSTTILLVGTGQQPNLIASYILAANSNQIPLTDNDTIQFPSTQIGQSSTATVVISNAGNGSGTVTGVTLPAGAFALSGLPLLPAQIDPGSKLQFTVQFSPATQQTATAVLQVVLPDRTIHVNLTGQGTGASFVYQATIGTAVSTVAANGTVALPNTNVGSSSSVNIQVQNTGTSSGQVAAIGITGTGFQLTNLPALPVTVALGQSFTFTVVFTPTQSGAVQARLMLDSVLINITGNGIGASLSLTLTQAGVTTPLSNNGTVIFPNTSVGSSSPATIQIGNTGNLSTNINSIGVTGGSFTLASVPAVPAPLGPGQTLQVNVNFAPAGVGAATGTLQINGLQINLSGVGLAPPSLPAVSFGGVGDTVGPAQQPSVSISLASPYPLDISGTLVLTFASNEFVDDPAIQFATGSRSVAFTIPANTTQAVFGAAGQQIQFQSGTVAGTITLTPNFAAGTVNLTPATPPVKVVAVAASAPQIRNVQIGTVTTSSFEVVVTGFSTPRAMTEMDLQFTASTRAKLLTTSLTVDVGSAFTTWYQSAASTAFGSQFSAVLDVSVVGDINAVQAVAVTAKNANGASAPVSVNVQ